MITMKRIPSLLLFLAVGAACQPQIPALSETVTAQPTAVQATLTPTLSSEATPAFLDEDAVPIQFQEIKMFDDEGVNDIEKTSGWAVAILADGYEYILHTEDGGRTWAHPTSTMGLLYTYSPPIFLSSQIAWNTNLDGMLERTMDGGETWNSVWDFANRFGDGEVSGLYFWDANRGMAKWAAIGAGNAFIGLNETDDGGATWSPLVLNPPWENSLENGLLHLCNLCGDRISLDGSRIMIVSGLTPNQLVQSEINIAISYDLGKTWNHGKLTIPDELKDHRVRYGGVTFFDEKHGVFYIWGNNQPSFEYYDEFSMLFPFYTEDGGLTWTLRTPINYIDAETFFSTSDAIARCGELLCVTNDGAHSWTLVQPDIKFKEVDNADGFGANYLIDLDFVNPNLGFAVLSTPDGATQLYQTSDGGRHWELIDWQIEK